MPCDARVAAGNPARSCRHRDDGAAAGRSDAPVLSLAIPGVCPERRHGASLPWPPGLQSIGRTPAIRRPQPTIARCFDHASVALTAPAPTPTIAVVVATHNRARLLPRLVEALAKQTDPGLVEVVVVDDASDDDTWDVLSALAATAPFRLTARRMAQNSGPAAARNVGWRAT